MHPVRAGASRQNGAALGNRSAACKPTAGLRATRSSVYGAGPPRSERPMLYHFIWRTCGTTRACEGLRPLHVLTAPGSGRGGPWAASLQTQAGQGAPLSSRPCTPRKAPGLMLRKDGQHSTGSVRAKGAGGSGLT
ncbi:PREDICTED: uncharacterized protein LOC109381465 isoform X2 [Hipposideros armiger]|uniref:Uncharacterized protein LOC109381465 isoform X2 n=1 Tax=Hipposideros armiger TaxID=186990 RepID=A0A8B7R6E0_HIPAR|nr:PREDICTED: uncharacterized protein LOC109381465 isoform X2 [Hipposideros armiger]